MMSTLWDKSKSRWVLGADDPEMQAIEKILIKEEQPYGYAVNVDCERVRGGLAYFATGFVFPDDPQGYYHGPQWGEVTHFVECDSNHANAFALPIAHPGGYRIDHHRAGDYGYNKGPKDFMTASSLGQVLALLRGGVCKYFERYTDGVGYPGWYMPGNVIEYAPVDQDLVLTAAADHCLREAYAGHCPGVDPHILLDFRVQQKATYQKTTTKAIYDLINQATSELRDCIFAQRLCQDSYTMPSWSKEVADLRDKDIPELAEAGCIVGIPYLTTVEEKKRTKIVLGAATPELVNQFLAGNIGPQMKNLYGDPMRGYAGGYLN